MAIAQLNSKIEAAKIYSAGATITRIAELNITANEAPEYIEIAGLPLALDDSSVRVRVEGGGGNAPIAADVRIGLAVPPRGETPNPPPDEELRAATAEVRQIEDAIALIDNEINVLSHLDVPDRPDGEPGKAPPPSPMGARLALANFSDEQIRARIKEKRETLEKLRKAKEHLADLQEKQARASTATEVRPNELRKTVVVSLSYGNTPTSEQTSRLVVEYFVPGARWTPTYVCRLNSAESSASIAVRALICQRTGEDWSGVRLELSTAEPMAWCALPELPSLRIGRAQPVVKKSGWRRPPIGAEILFEDFDRQKEGAIAAADKNRDNDDFFSPEVPPLFSLNDTREAFLSPEVEEISFTESIKPSPKPPRAAQTFGQAFGHLERDIVTRSPRTVKDEFGQLEDLLGGLPAELAANTPSPSPQMSKAVFREEASLGLPEPRGQRRRRSNMEEESTTDFLAYNLMRMGDANDPSKRGKLSIEQRQEFYLEILQRQQIVANFDIIDAIERAVANAEKCMRSPLPPGGINVRNVAGSFDYAYSADGRIDVPSDGQFHSVALTSSSAEVDVRYVVVPREDTNVFRIAQLRNPLQAPLLAGMADVYVDGEYILSTNIATVPAKGQMELGLGVEQAIKVARNTFYEEVRSGETIVSFNELRHKVQVDIKNNLPRVARIEVRERLPIPYEGAKVDVQIDSVLPGWEKYEQEERNAPIKGGYRWRVEVPAKGDINLSVDYKIKTFVDSELIGGNRREG
ncbi:DUF4139 domain-containing protein [Microcoleus sp. FACHB-831]|uniref:DUF4139 domain-containing protein n=1 Tax=Microcoleus sp. FACHB-831 TaxID=2692827 RepID=UPI00168969AB|nr:DUF4139 domain-containing protein [Microcoleus sp. FACHB-831]MBD1919962.1 DUF4139 domain-containing protein [Microcoleus sp. FACHB-831]